MLVVALALAGQAWGQATSTLTVSGKVAQPLTLTIDDLKRQPVHTIDYPPQDSARANDSGALHRRYSGCLLRDVLAAARPAESRARDLRKSYVVATASDGYEVLFSWAELFVSPIGDSAIVAYERDGRPLGDDEGRIALIVPGDTRPVRHVKWLQSVRLQTAD